jgi:hypothetical protein
VTFGSRVAPIDPRDATGTIGAQRAAEMATLLAVPLTPDRPRLRLVLGRLASGENALAVLAKLSALIAGLDAVEYHFTVDFVLTYALPLCTTVTNHTDLVSHLCRNDDRTAFADAYGSAIERTAAKTRRADWLAAPLVAWLEFAGGTGPASGIAAAILDRLARRLASRGSEKDAVIDAARRRIGDDADANAQVALEKLVQFEEEVLSHQASLLGSLRRVGSDLLGRALPFRSRR